MPADNLSAAQAGELPPALAAGLAELPPEQQAGLAAAARRYAALAPDEQALVRAAAERELLEGQAGQVVEAVQDAARRGRAAALLPRLAEAAAANRQDFPELAYFIEAAAALLRGESQAAVPEAYRAQYAALDALLAPGSVAQPPDGQPPAHGEPGQRGGDAP